MESKVDVFFYGSYINFQVLKEVNIDKRPFHPGSVNGFELVIAPLANLKPQKDATAFGILTRLNHAELERLYQEHAKGILGGEYLPRAVLVYQWNGLHKPALTYISHTLTPTRAKPDYVDRILTPARQYEFPPWYLDHIASFK